MKNEYEEYRNDFYNPDDSTGASDKPGDNANWKAIQKGFYEMQSAAAPVIEVVQSIIEIGENAGLPLIVIGTVESQYAANVPLEIQASYTISDLIEDEYYIGNSRPVANTKYLLIPVACVKADNPFLVSDFRAEIMNYPETATFPIIEFDANGTLVDTGIMSIAYHGEITAVGDYTINIMAIGIPIVHG